MMKTINLKYSIIFLTTFIFTLVSSTAQTIELTIHNFQSSSGMVCIAVFTSEKDFKVEKPFYELKLPKKDKSTENIEVTFNLPPGEFGVSVLHDENMNGIMDYNFVGIPREGFGFSNYYQRGLKKPTFKNFCFNLYNHEIKQITIKLKYF